MKVCLSSRQISSYLKKADEIKVQFRDRAVIPELAEKYPNASIILRQDLADPFDWKECERLKILTRDKLIICANDIKAMQESKAREIPFYYGFPIQTYAQLNALVNLGVNYVLLDAPLFFDLENIKKHYNVAIRAIPNVSWNDGFPRLNGVSGTWIRPEDSEAYDEYIDTFEFEKCDQNTEQALYRVYFEDKEWKTDLGLLISDLNHIGNNRFIRSKESTRRINCRQKCEEHGACHLCYRMLDLASPELIEKYKESR